MSLYLDGKKIIDNGIQYGTDLPMSSSNSNKVTDEINGVKSGKVDKTDFYATELPIQSGSATNTKDYIDAVSGSIPTQIQDLSNVVFGTLSGGQVLTIETGTGNVINAMPAVRWAGSYSNIGHTNWASGCYLYSYDSNSISAPTTTGGYAMSFFNADNNKYGCQVAFTNGGFYWRKLTNNTYGAWVTLAT